MSGYDDRSEFPSSVLLPTFSKGFDPVVLRKQASIFEKEYDAFERKPGHSYIHLISVAAGDYYGPNSRADFYNGCSYRHKFPHPEKNATAYIDLDGGIGKYHNPTFMKHGGVYTEHFSSRDGAKPQGYIVAAKVNPDMHRGELIIGVKTDLWRDDIEHLSKGHPMKFPSGVMRRMISAATADELHIRKVSTAITINTSADRSTMKARSITLFQIRRCITTSAVSPLLRKRSRFPLRKLPPQLISHNGSRIRSIPRLPH